MLSDVLAGFVARTHFEDLPGDAVNMAKKCFLDWLGCAILGSKDRSIQMIAKVAKEQGGAEQATVVGTWERTSILNACLVNGASSHVAELDDLHKEAMYHPGVACIPAALAVGESQHCTGKELITAIVLGYEVGIRIGLAVNPSHFYRWHTTGTAGTFAAAAAAAKIMGLSRTQMVSALGNAGTQASGLWEFLTDGAMTKPLHPGKACMNGALAALLAREGFTGASQILEGDRGFCKATSTDCKFDEITRDLGKRFKILETGFKIHVGCRHTNSPVDNALKIVRTHDIKPQDVDRITIKVYKLAHHLVGKFHITSVTDAKFSIPCLVATAVKFRRVGPGEVSEDLLRDREVADIMRRTELVVDEELERRFPKGFASDVEIRTKDGAVYHAKADYARGDPENPVSLAELEEKFRTVTSGVLERGVAERLIDACRQLELFRDVSGVFSVLHC